MPTKSRWVLVALCVSIAFASNSCTSSRVPSPSITNSMWIATQNDGMVRSYTIDRTSGSISPIGSDGGPISAGTQPSAIALTPDGGTLFAASAGDNTIRSYIVHTDGSLQALSSPIGAGTTPKALVVDPTGTLIFVANEGSDTIMVFKNNVGTPVLNVSFPVQTPAVPGGSGPVALAVSPATFPCIDNRTTTPRLRHCYALYVANQTAGTVSAYDYFVDSNGAFVLGSMDLIGNFIVGGTVAGSPYPVGTNPSGLAFSRCAGFTSITQNTSCAAPDGNNLFVANAGSNNISIFSACIQLQTCNSGETNPDGTLTQVGSPVASGLAPTTILVNPASNFVYAVDAGSTDVSEYQYSSATGALTLFGTTGAVGTSAFSGAITGNISNSPNTSNWVVVTNNGSVSALSVGADGKLNTSSSGQYTLSGQPSAVLLR